MRGASRSTCSRRIRSAIAQHFARSGLPPLIAWDGIALHESELPEPLIDGALTWLGCATVGTHEVGDHTIFVGAVESIELGAADAGSAYVRGGYEPA